MIGSTVKVIVFMLYLCTSSSESLHLTISWTNSVATQILLSPNLRCAFDSRPLHYQVTTLGKLFTPMCHQAVQFGTGQRVVMLCGREDNHRSGVALAMRHRL